METIDTDKLKKFKETLADIIVISQGICTYQDCKDIAESEASLLIATLQQEQPEVDLKNEIISQWSKCNPTDEGMGSEYAIIAVEQFAAIAHHFYKLGLNARKEE